MTSRLLEGTKPRAAVHWIPLATLLLIVLKTTGAASMSWWVVFSPVLFPLVLLAVTAAIGIAVLLLCAVIAVFYTPKDPVSFHQNHERTVNPEERGTLH